MTKKRKTFLITKNKDKNKISFFKKKGFKVIFLESLANEKDLKLMLQNVYKLGYRRAFFETGLTFLNSLINLFIFMLIGLNNNSIKYLKKIKLTKKICVNLNNDNLYKIEF